MHTRLTQLLVALLCLILLGSAGCRQKPTGGDGRPGKENDGRLTGPGIDLRRVGIGLPTEAIDYTGMSGNALAGAKTSGEVFFGVTLGDNTRIYRRNLKSGERTYITELTRLSPGSLATTPDGKTLTYCRLRAIKDVIDDPKVGYPPDLAVPYVFDVGSRVERRLFDFNAEDIRLWRGSSLAPFIAPNGKRICVLAYDSDRLLLHSEATEWLDREAQLRGGTLKKADADATRDLIEGFLKSAAMRDRLLSVGITVDEAKPITDAVRTAMNKFKADTAAIRMALLVWEDGKSRTVPLTAEANLAEHFHYIAALGNDALVVGAQGMESSPYSEQPLYNCDLASGKLTRFGSINGLSKLVTLNSDESGLLICYSPVRGADKAILPETFLLRMPLDGSATSETSLAGDYVGVVDLDADATHMVGQDITDYNLYLVNIASGRRNNISEQMSALSGVLLLGDASALAYLHQGVIYRVALGPDAESKRVTADHFSSYKTEIHSFMTKVGFTPPAEGYTYNWEERDGLGAHTVSMQMAQEDKPENAALVRYDVDRKTVTALWLPDVAAYPFPAQADLKGKDFDYYDAEKLAKAVMDRSGWIAADRRTQYQPGPNPLYDKRTDSYVVTFRDSYELKATGDTVYANEATLRVLAKAGKLAEMTFVPVDEVQDQPIKVERSRLPFLVRNVPDQPIPEDAPVTIDAEKARMIVFAKTDQLVQDGVFQAKKSYRLCWEVDTYLEPNKDLVFTYIIDAETGEKLGSLSYMPMAPAATTVDR